MAECQGKRMQSRMEWPHCGDIVSKTTYYHHHSHCQLIEKTRCPQYSDRGDDSDESVDMPMGG